MKTERIEWLSNNPFYTKRFAYTVGRKCRVMTIQDAAKEYKLDWHTVKALDKEYMEKQLLRNPVAAPRVIGIDEISMRKGHTYLPVLKADRSNSGKRHREEKTYLVWREG